LLAAAVLALAVVLAATPALSAQQGTPPTRLCAVATGSDQPDIVSAFLVHVVYAVPADAADRFGERSLPILSDLASIEAWWQAQDTTRSPRFDLLGGDCDSRMGRLDVSHVRLPREAAYYADPRQGFERIVADIESLPLAFSAPEKKYLVYYDGPVQRRSICGTSPLGPARANACSVVYVDSLCGGDLGRGGEAASVAVHELVHSLAALPRAHPCAGNQAHACDNWQDILYPAVESGTRLDRLFLDIGHDDYYGLATPNGSSFDVRDSPFLEHLDAAYPRTPREVGGLFAVSHGSRVKLSWAPGSVSPGRRYRVYRDGRLLSETTRLTAVDDGTPGTTNVYGVRVADAVGYLSAVQTVRVLVGTGVVDEHGATVADTFAPPGVSGLRATRTGVTVTLRWNPVDDPGDLAGYRVFRNGVRFGGLRKQTWLAVGAFRARASWSVAAADTSGNVGPRCHAVRVR
jgi:hypothetical protein